MEITNLNKFDSIKFIESEILCENVIKENNEYFTFLKKDNDYSPLPFVQKIPLSNSGYYAKDVDANYYYDLETKTLKTKLGIKFLHSDDKNSVVKFFETVSEYEDYKKNLLNKLKNLDNYFEL